MTKTCPLYPFGIYKIKNVVIPKSLKRLVLKKNLTHPILNNKSWDIIFNVHNILCLWLGFLFVAFEIGSPAVAGLA